MQTMTTKPFSAGKDLPNITVTFPVPDTATAEGVDSVVAHKIVVAAARAKAVLLAKSLFRSQGDSLNATKLVVDALTAIGASPEKIEEYLIQKGMQIRPLTDFTISFEDLYSADAWSGKRGRRANDSEPNADSDADSDQDEADDNEE